MCAYIKPSMVIKQQEFSIHLPGSCSEISNINCKVSSSAATQLWLDAGGP